MDRTPRPPAHPATETLAAFADELDSDDRTLRRALAVAIACHLALLASRLPLLSAAPPPEPRARKVFQVQTPRFVEPVEPEPPIPQRRERVVPVPDPTPDEPEPLRPLEVEPVAYVPDSGLVVDIPAAPPPPPPAGPIVVSGDVVPPEKRFAPPPPYPEVALRTRTEGLVVLQAIIGVSGSVENVRVLRGHPLLEQAAVTAVKSWTFSPATLHGEPVAVYYTLTVNFVIG